MHAPLPVEAKWPILDRSKLQLFSLDTPNGIKIAVALEELGLPYEPHLVDIGKGEQFTEAFVSISPNSKIPALVDLHGPGDQPLALMESGSILIYLAEKAGRLIPTDPARRYQCLQWLFFQVGNIGPLFGQFGHFFKYARDKCNDPYPLERYTKEAKRLLAVLERHFTEHAYLVDEYSIADIATFPWVNGLSTSYQADEVLALASYARVQDWLTRCKARPAFERGRRVTSKKAFT